LRCRYCNKAISLLRRLNDAEYCSDAHRFADQAEQQLAMQRLAQTQPALQRTQRMAAAKPVGSLVSETPAQPGSMALVGEHLPFSPPAIESGWQPLLPAEPLHVALTVLFLERAHRFQSSMPWGEDSLPVPMGAEELVRGPASVVGQSAQMRIVIPRDLTSRMGRQERWRAIPSQQLEAVGLEAKEARRPDMTGAVPEPVFDLKWLHRTHLRRERDLAPTNRLSSLAMPPAGKEARCIRSEDTDRPFFQAAKACIPASRLAAAAPVRPLPLEENPEQFWELLEATGLGALLLATSYPEVKPAAGAPSGKIFAEPLEAAVFPAPAAVYPRGAQASTFRQPDAIFGLEAVGTPAPAVLHCGQTASEAALETPVEVRYPQRGSRNAGRSMDAAKAVLAVAAPAAAPGRIAVARFDAGAAQAEGGRPFTRLPESQSAPSARLALHPQTAVQPVEAPESAAPRPVNFWDSGWAGVRQTQCFPSAGFVFQLPNLGAAEAGPLPALAVAGTRPVPLISEAWFPAVVTTRLPSGRNGREVSQIRLGERVEFDLRPDAVNAANRPYFDQKLRPVVAVRLPKLFEKRLVNRYGSAECVPLSPPPPKAIPWKAAIVSGTDLAPRAILPARPEKAGGKALQNIPVRLFAVPRAKPAARPGEGKPRVIGMDLWASPPAICAASIPFDDGKPRSKRESTQQMAKAFFARFSTDGLRNAWTKANRLPSDLKWIAMVVPLILGIWVLARPASSEPAKVSIPAAQETAAAEPEATESESQAAVRPVSAPPVIEKAAPPKQEAKSAAAAPAAEPTRWEILQARIANRASVDLIEDFRNGLSQWEGRGEWSRTWTYDQSGTVRPGQMAIFQPTIALKDYTLEMKASIDRRSIQWVVRATNAQNYHLARLNVTPGAPLTKLEFERWSVVNGRVSKVTRFPLPHGGANQTLYTIRVETKGDSITTSLGDQVIDTFSDSRLPEGGIGLIGASEDRARIYGIHVSHQNDFLGKLCSFLAPPPINNQGSD